MNGQAQIINTIAGKGTAHGPGSGGYSGDSGTATSAELNNPVGIKLDSHGNLMIADNENHRIRKIDTNKIITTLAGNGNDGFSGDNGFATAAEFGYIMYLNINKRNEIIIPDESKYRIREINSLGIITTIAGDTIPGNTGNGGPATAAEVCNPTGIASDKYGNLYFSDACSYIRKIDTNNIITTICGNGLFYYFGDGGLATNAVLSWPADITVDLNSNIYISDLYNNKIRKIDSASIISTFAGSDTLGGYSGDHGPATDAKLYHPEGIITDDIGNVYFSDCSNFVVRKIDTAGIITTIVGNGIEGFGGDGGPATAAKLDRPAGLAFDKHGNLYIADWWNNRIRMVTNVGVMLETKDVRDGANGEREIKLYPNPATNQITVEGANGCEVIFYNILGSEKLKLKTEKMKEIVDIGSLNEGVYSVAVIDLESGERVVRKLVKSEP